VLVAVTDIPAHQLVTAEMVEIKSVPIYVAPLQAATALDQVLNRIATGPVPAGSFLIREQFIDPTDPNSPILYTMDKSLVLMAIPSTALLGNLGMLKVGDRVDIAYTTDLEAKILSKTSGQVMTEEEQAKADENKDVIPVTFFSLQNIEIKGLASFVLPTEGVVVAPDAVLVAVNPQDALALKYLMDTGADMEMFLRAPGNDTLTPLLPVDQEYLINRFQLHLSAPVNFANVADVPSFNSVAPVNEQIVNQSADSLETGQPASTGN
jgi:Flp pilus assembly protein CpaB